MKYMLGQIAFYLGVTTSNIKDWIKEKGLKCTQSNYGPVISFDELAIFLAHNRDCVGQLYCQGCLFVVDQFRKNLIERIEFIGF